MSFGLRAFPELQFMLLNLKTHRETEYVLIHPYLMREAVRVTANICDNRCPPWQPMNSCISHRLIYSLKHKQFGYILANAERLFYNRPQRRH